MTSDQNGIDRRRFKRYEINLGALIAFDEPIIFASEELSTLQCNILDFCTQGLFLEIKQGLSELSLLLHKRVKILFSIVTEQGKQFVQIDAEVMRVCSNGVGVAFENVSDSIFQALVKKATSKTASTSQPANHRQIADRERLKNLLAGAFDRHLPSVMAAFFSRVHIDLEQAAKQAGNGQDETQFFNTSKDLKLCQGVFEQRFIELITETIEFVHKDPIVHSMPAKESPSLSLIDKEEFEDWLNFASCIRKVENYYSDQLVQLELKLSLVTGLPRKILVNPANPGKLFDAFKETVNGIEELQAIKQTLFKIFERTLLDHLDKLYDDIDQILVSCGAQEHVVEVIKRNAKPQPAPSLQRHNTSTEASRHNDADKPSEFQTSAAISAQTIPEQAPKSRERQRIAETASRLLGIIDAKNGVGNTSVESDRQNTTESSYSVDDILSAISQLQNNEVATNELHQNSASLQKQLTETLASSLGTRSFSALDKNRLEVYGQWFDTLMNDLMFTPHIKSYLESIHLPLMALSVKDADFLDSEHHPARSVLNQLSLLESAVKSNRIYKTRKIGDILDQLFARIAQEGMDNPDIFVVVDEQIKEISQHVAKSSESNIRRVVEAYEGKQKLEQARLLIQREIDERLSGKVVPKVIPTLLDSGWQHLLLITELNDENHANTRGKYLKIIDHLMKWLAYPGNFDETQILEIQRVLAFIENKLGSVCTNAFLHDKVMDELKASLLGTGMPRVRKTVEKIFIEPGRGRQAENPQTGQDIIETNWTRQVARFQVGDWFTFSLEAEEFEPLKLVWINSDRRQFVFVNREGQKKLELNREELIALTRSGSVNKIESLDDPLMERAANMMLQKMHEKLAYDASHDPITGLINRREFIRQLKDCLTSMDQAKHILCYLEVINFRTITNICGLTAGDELLRNISQLINIKPGQKTVCSRMGDKTFGLLIKHCPEQESYQIAKNLSEKIRKTHFKWEEKSFSIDVSLGIVPFFNNGFGVDELLKQADSASISAKNSGHNRIRIYREDDDAIKFQANLHDWIGRIDQILSDNRLFVRCQKIAPIKPDKSSHSHFEILLGIRDEDGSIVAPIDFLPAVEHCRRMPEIDAWMIRNVFEWIEQNEDSFTQIGGFAINLSGQSLNSEEFLEQLLQRLKSSRFPLHKITFEVTETVASDNLLFTESFISQIKQFGCKFSLDDFGTGYSSYSYLKRLDVDYLKIDGSFIKEIVDNSTDVAMVKSINEIAHSLGLETIAEYVESKEIHDVLKGIGVDYGQGWIIHRPMNLSELSYRAIVA